MSETDLVRDTIKTLRLLGVWCWRTNSGTKGYVKLSPAGTPDILGVLPGGFLFGLEGKSSKGKQRDSQVEWQADAERNGVRYALFRTVEEAAQKVIGWRQETSSWAATTSREEKTK